MSTTEITYTDANYWNQRWNDNEISFHKSTNHPFLEKHFEKLKNNDTAIMRILFPLCGKEIDMAWLASMGHEIIGIEFSQSACEQFFNENNIQYSVSELNDSKLFKSADGKIKIYNGDFFKFSLAYEAAFECVWDRGSLVALPPDLRIKYANHIQALLATNFKYLLDTYDYDQELYPGPPHSVRLEEIQKLFGNKCKIELLESQLHNRPFNEKLKDSNTLYNRLYFLTNF